MNNYVFEGAEVHLTGRCAIKQIVTSRTTVEDKLIEIQPADKEGPSWKKWVRETELYKIVDKSQ